jgi:hypothetical protein
VCGNFLILLTNAVIATVSGGFSPNK